MKVQVTVNNVKIIEPSILNENEYNIHECEFEFTEEYNGLTKKAVFTNQANETYVETIVDDKCSIPSEVLKDKENVKLGVYAYDVENEELLLRYSPRPTEFYVHEGSYKEGQNSTPPTPSEVEQLQAQITQNANDIEDIQDNIVEINEQQEIQDETIQNITETIGTINETIGTINETIGEINQDIDNLESTKADKSEIPIKTSDLINDSDFVSDSEYVHTDNNFTNAYKGEIIQNTSDIGVLYNIKADKSEIPTKTSQLINDSGFITKNVNDLANYYKKSETYNKTEIDGKVSSVYKYKGTVATYEDLPSTDLTIGDVYNVEEDGSNYAWTGNSWDKLGGDIDLSEYYTKTQTDSLLSAKANSSDVYTKNETYNKTEVNTLLNDKVDKVDGKGLSTNDFTDSYKNQIEANQTAITNIKDGTTIDSFGDVETALNDKEDKSNKVTSISSESTDTQYPSAKCVYDELEAKQSEIEDLQQDVEDLRNASYKVPGTGTDITLNNTAQGRLLKNDLSGRTEQESLSGKNLLTFPYTTSSELIDNKGKLIIGTLSNAISITFATTLILPAGTYILSGNSSGENFPNISYMLLKNEDNNTFINNYIRKNYSFSLETQTTISCGIVLPSGTYNTDIEPMIRLSSIADNNWEPYCGGIPAPNPIYKIPIKNVTGNANEKIQNKNLAWNGWAEDFVERINNTNRARIENYDNRNCLFYNANAGYQEYDTKYIFKTNFKDNTAYTFSFDIYTTQTRGNICIAYTDGSVYEPNNITVNSWQKLILTSNPEKTVKYLRTFYRDGSSRIDLDTFMVLEGAYTSETIPSYVAHEEQNYPFTFTEGQRGMQGTQPKDDGIHNKRKQVVLNGTESIDLNSIIENYYISFSIKEYANIVSKDNPSDLLCNMLQNVSSGFIANTCRIASSGNVIVTFSYNFCEYSVSGIKDKLQQLYNNGTPLIIEIPLAEEEIIPYNETQQSQYNDIKNAKSDDDITYITSTSDELGFIMDVESLGNINKVINNLLNN